MRAPDVASYDDLKNTNRHSTCSAATRSGKPAADARFHPGRLGQAWRFAGGLALTDRRAAASGRRVYIRAGELRSASVRRVIAGTTPRPGRASNSVI
ncbi:hypothetical protein M8494_11465 [Serratia ureilytica]